jgi:rhodanese-related sulfurtransferase
MMMAARAAVPAITPQEAGQLLQGGNALLVDVRDGTEVQASGKAKGALHVSRGFLEFKADPESPMYDPAFRKDRTIILYCASGGRSALAGKTLKDMGYADVRNLGGFPDWIASGGEVER